MSGSVAQSIDDSGKEKTDCITRQANGVETEGVEPDLDVFERLEYIIPCELFFPSRVAIVLESCGNEFSLLRSEELGGRGVIVYEEVRRCRADNSKQTLLECCVTSRTESRISGAYHNKDPPPPTQASNSLHFGEGEPLECCKYSVKYET